MKLKIFQEGASPEEAYFKLTRIGDNEIVLLECDRNGEPINCGQLLRIAAKGITLIGAYKGSLPVDPCRETVLILHKEHLPIP